MTTKHITLEDLCAHSGAGPMRARRLVRNRKLPGFIDGNTYICPPGEFQDWLDGKWEYRGVPSTPPRDRSGDAGKKASPFIRKIKSEAA